MLRNSKYQTILICGFGVVGSLLAKLLDNLGLKIVIIDQNLHKYKNFKFYQIDVTDEKNLIKIIKSEKIDALVSCLPFSFNKGLVKICLKAKIDYFDPTEDVETVNFIKDNCKDSQNLFLPQNGLAPGLINILAHQLIKKYDKNSITNARLRVGALPQNPIGDFGYACNWSVEGLVNEYIKPSVILEDFTIKTVASLERKEVITIQGTQYEAFLTSGGVGSLCHSYKDEVQNLNYKTIRYPGHLDCIKIVINQLKLRNNPKVIEDLFRNAFLADDMDHVLIHVAVEGAINNKKIINEFVADYAPIKLFDKYQTAIAWTTASAIAANVEIAAQNKLGSGFMRQEDIDCKKFFATKSGENYVKYHQNANIFERLLNAN